MNASTSKLPLWAWPLVFLVALTLLGFTLASISSRVTDGELATGLGYFFPIYAGFWGVVMGIIFSVNLHQGSPHRQAFNSAISWAGIWHAIVAAFVGGGAVTGALLFLVVGTLAGMDYSTIELIRNGAGDGAFYLTIWSPGLALVLCVMRAYRKSQQAKA